MSVVLGLVLSLVSFTQPPIAVALNVSGGLIGFDRRVEISAAGDIRAIDRRRNLTRTAKTSAAELAEIHTLLNKIAAADARTPQCNDCIAYELIVDRAGVRTVVRVDDVALERSPARPAIEKLSALLERVLAEKALQ